MEPCPNCAPSRRDFIRVTLATSAGAALASRFGLAYGQEAAGAKAKSVILLWMQGAASQFETWDPKPGADTGGPTKAADTGRGYAINARLERMSKLAAKYSVIRTLNSNDPNHETARYLLHTGHRRIDTVDYPHLGSLISSELGMKAEGLPGCVALGGDSGIGSGFLPPDTTPFFIEKIDKPTEDIALAPGMTKWRLDDREALLKAQNDSFRKDHDDRKVAEHQKAAERALALMRSPHIKAFDVDKEPEEAKKLYGPTPFGRACLLARRLVQAGTRFVEVSLGDWDTHADNFNRTDKLIEQLDPGFSALLTDLERQSMLDETLVIWLSEFGRTPRVNIVNGRDHFSKAWSCVLAGGGIQGGRVVGKTNVDGTAVAERPVPVADLYATIYKQLGIDTEKKFHSGTGRPVKVLDSGEPVKELL
jgi:uncharacterized protein (DUF1501 family)